MRFCDIQSMLYFSDTIMADTGLRPFHEESDDWQDWFEAFQNFLVMKAIKKNSMKLAALKLHGGTEIRKLLKNLPQPPVEDCLTPYHEAISRLSKYFEQTYNNLHEITVFNAMKQMQGESVRKYLVRLRTQSVKCKFSDAEDRIREQFVQGLADEQARNHAILKNLSLTQVIQEASLNETLKPASGRNKN